MYMLSILGSPSYSRKYASLYLSHTHTQCREIYLFCMYLKTLIQFMRQDTSTDALSVIECLTRLTGECRPAQDLDALFHSRCGSLAVLAASTMFMGMCPTFHPFPWVHFWMTDHLEYKFCYTTKTREHIQSRQIFRDRRRIVGRWYYQIN